MLRILIILSTTFSICFLIILLNISTPATAGPFGILVIFLLTYFSLIGLMAYLLYGVSRIIAHFSTVLITRRPFEALTLKRSYYYASVAAAAPIMLIGLQSVGNVGIYEFLLVSIFIVIGCLYISKRVH